MLFFIGSVIKNKGNEKVPLGSGQVRKDIVHMRIHQENIDVIETE